ncbi:MAG TPA: RNA polymerase sigma factor [Candidatus Limnocylindria bacterium]|nr:RNA polymerase sigma factor [Candidatus Limnocylindria bacterium]
MRGGDLVLGFASLRDTSVIGASRAPDGRGAIPDAQLVALARESPAEAIEVLYGAYKARIYTFLLRLLSDPELADDVTQDTFTKAYQSLGTLTNEHRVLSWLYRIANNAAIDHLRRRKRISWLRVGGILGGPDEPTVRDANDALPEKDHVRSVLAGMPVEQATALLLHALEGYSYKEIAEIQGSTLPAVRSRIARARVAFKMAYETKDTPGSS